MSEVVNLKYVSTLPPKFQKIAEKELRETESRRKQALEQIGEWLKKHPHIKKYPDGNFIVRYLRKCKFNVAETCKFLESDFRARQLKASYFGTTDVGESRMQELLGSGYQFYSIDSDPLGRRVFIIRPQYFDTDRFTCADSLQLSTVILDALCLDEIFQVAGVIFIVDGSMTSMKHMSIFSMMDIQLMWHLLQKSNPARLKQILAINIPPMAQSILEFFIRHSSDKIRKRFLVLKSAEDVVKYVDPKILPTDYGGRIPIAQCIRDFKEDITKRRQDLLDVYNSFETNYPDNEDLDGPSYGVTGSFRKLEID